MKKSILILVLLLLVNTVSFADTTGVEYLKEYGIAVEADAEYTLNVLLQESSSFKDVTYITEIAGPKYTSVTDTVQNYANSAFSVVSSVPNVQVTLSRLYNLVEDIPGIPTDNLTYARLTDFPMYTEYLEANKYYDYTNPVVVALAKKLGLSQTVSPLDNINKIATAVILTTKYDLQEIGLTPASQVITEATGVCSDYTTMTVALLRSVGIPARGVSGYMLNSTTDSQGVGHMWTEINVDGKWYILETTISLQGTSIPKLDVSFINGVVQKGTYIPLNIEYGKEEMNTIKVNASGYGLRKLVFTKSGYTITRNVEVPIPVAEPSTTPPVVVKTESLTARFAAIAAGMSREGNGLFTTGPAGLTNHWAFQYLQDTDSIFKVEDVLLDLDLNRQITRDEVVSALDAYLDLDSLYTVKSEAGFTDSDSPSVNRVVQLGILSGYPDGTFRPDANISRAELFAVLSRVVAFTELSPTCTPKTFVDIKGHWSENSIYNLGKILTIAGFTDNTVRPNSKVTSGEFVTLLSRINESLAKNQN